MFVLDPLGTAEPGEGGGGLPYKIDGDARQKIKIKPLS